MNIEELANKYKAEIPNTLSEIEFLKAVYIKLAHKKAFDERYYFGNASTTRKIYALAEREKNHTTSIDKKRTIICYSLSYEIKHLLREFGFNCFVTVSSEMGDHVFPIVVLSDGTQIKFDLQKDLENIQTHCKTQYFATKDKDDFGFNLRVIDEDGQFEIDRAIGYVSCKEDYRDMDIEKLNKKFAETPNLTVWERLSIILSDSSINNIPESAGYIECFRYYSKRIFPRFFSSKELSGKVHTITCAKKTEDGQEFTNCIYVDDKSAPSEVYVFSRVHNRYILTSFDNLIKLEEEGLIIGNKYPGNGVSRLRKQLNLYKRSKQMALENIPSDDSHSEH